MTTSPAAALLEAASAARPWPVPTPLSAPHWEGCRRGELLAQRCARCGRSTFPPVRSCPQCGSSELRWEASTGRGRIYSFTAVWRPQLPTYPAPYVIAVVAVDEGWHLFTNVIGCTIAEIHVDMPVRVEFVAVSDEITLPFFTPVGAPAKGASA